MATVEYGETTRQVRLEYVPDVGLDDYVIVHMGFAVSRMTAEEAAEALDALGAIRGLSGIERPSRSTNDVGGQQ